MPIDVNLPDGRVIVFPDGTEKEVIERTAKRAIDNPESLRTTKELESVPAAPSTLRDINESAAMGLAGGIKGLSDIFGVNNAVSKKMEELQREAYGRLTPERQREMAIEDELSRRASEEGMLAEAKQAGRSFLRSPIQTGVGAAFSSAPMIAATALAPEATVPAMVTGLAGRSGLAGLLGRGASAAIVGSPAIAVGAAMGVGSQKGQDYERVKQAMLDAGRSEEEAEDAAQKAAEYSLQNAARQAAAGVAGGAEGAFGVESLLGRAGRARPGVKAGPEAPTWKGAIAQSTLGEALPEAIQSGVGAVGSNIALQQAGIDTDLFKGVTGEVTTGALAGALMGTAVSPLQMRQLRQEYGRDVLEKKLEEIRKQQEQVAKTKEELGTPTALALPAPAPKVEEQDPLQNPLGNLTKDELGPEVTGYIEQYRSKNGMPLLNSYSIEDVKDAMTQVNPAGEAAALDSLVAAKSGYQPDVTYSAQDVLNAATNKVDTTTQGFRDFLNRTTGNSDLNTMSQPQLYAAFKALESVPVGQGLTILPEGSNASRFTEAQMDKGLDKVQAAIQSNKENPAVTPEQAINIVKKATKLKQDRDAASLLKQLVKENHLDIDADGNFIAPTKIENLPAGYTLEKGTFKQSDQQLYGVLSDGKPLEGVDTYTNPEDAQAKVDALNKTREKQAEIIAQQIKKAQDQIDQSQQELDAMEAAGEGGTAKYKKAKAKHDAMTSKIGDDYSDLYARYEMFKTPLTMGPMGMKQVNRTGYTLFKDGVPVSTHPTTDAALDSLVGTMPEADVATLAQDKAPGMRTLARKARQRLEGKERIAEKEAEEAAIPEEEKTARAEEKEKAEQMFKQLGAILKKFGLGDLQLQIVKGMEDEGSYVANLIKIALDAKDAIGVLRHESIHALKDLGFFSPQQWAALERMAKEKWINQYLKGVPHDETRSRYDAYVDEYKGKISEAELESLLIEEAIADAFRAFGNKPPPGMLTAIINKIKQFFDRLKRALGSAGYETAEDIFGKIERGELKTKVPTPSKIDAKMSLRQANYNKDVNRLEVSTTRPTSVRPLPGEIAPRNPIKDFYVIDSEDIMSVPSHMAAAHNAISAYNWFPISNDPNATVRAMKDTIVDNLVWLYNLTPENIRQRARLWYNGANRIAKDWSKIYHYNVRQMAGVLAVLSPQKDWFMNTTLGERVVHVYTQQQNTAWSPDMTAWAESYVKASRDIETRDKRQVVLDAAKRLQGTNLKDMSLEDMAYFVRIYDETYYSRKYRVVTPEGMFGDFVTVNEEVSEDEDESSGQGDVAWGTYDSIQKAISILQDGSHENISEQLGDEHKVRNFYNNIVDPESASGSVTIDTHAVAAASFKALSGASLEVLHNFGTTPKGLVSAGGSAMTGASGTYGFIADAYREAAAMVGVLPREMQSITWEAVRSIFPAAWKSQNAGQVNAIYDRFKSGEITLKEARDEVLKISGGIKKFAWENDKSGVFPSAGATSFDVTKQEPRVLQPYQIREKLKINLSAAPSTDQGAEVIPGIDYLFGKARNNDMAAYTLLQEVASDNARHLLGGIENVKITTVPASGLYDNQFEPSVNLAIAFNYGDKVSVLPALKRFASNFKQKQIHVRQVSKLDVETEYDDGSYNTPVFTFKLEDSFSRSEIQQIVKESGIPGITFTENQVVAYFMRGKKSETAEAFYGQIEKLAEQIGGFASTIDATVERLWVYGTGYGATQGYGTIKGDIRPGAGVTVQTAKRVAAYLNNVRDGKIKTFENADITDEQANKQNAIGDMYDKLPVYDMDRPIVRRAYEALAKALLQQYKALPINISWSKKKNNKGQPVDAYDSNSAEMRKDILNNNRLQILPTTPESFGPEGYDFSGHPLLEETELTLDGRKLLYNDLLRAVHDYYAHGMTEVGFGPKGEEAAWKNHMSITKDPLARWALTMETRAQNSYVNFRSGLDRNKVPLKKRGFAEQKAALLPVEVALTGNASVDAPMKEFIKTLSKEERLGSAGNIKLEKKSLRAPNTKEFKQFFGRSKIVNADGTPKVMYHGLAKDTTDFTRKTGRGAPIFLTDDPEFAQRFAADSYLQVAAHPEKYLTKEQLKDGEKKAIFAIRKDYGKDTLGKEMIDSIRDGSPTAEAREYLQKEYVNLLPAGPHIMPLYVRAENPFDYQNSRHIDRLKEEIELDGDLWRSVREGDWDVIESQEVQDAIQMAGFDSFYVKEHGRKNLAVYQPTQVKSATGNEGTYDITNPDVRKSLRAPDTKEFNDWFSDSKTVKNDKPEVMFIGTAKDISKYEPGEPIIVSSDPATAAVYSEKSMQWLSENAADQLTDEQKEKAKADAVAMVQEEYADLDKKAPGYKQRLAVKQDLIEDIRRRAFTKRPMSKKAVSILASATRDYLPTAENVMPVFVRATKPFDYQNEKHQQMVVDYVFNRIEHPDVQNPEHKILRGLKGLLAQGNKKNIVENPQVQKAIRALNFDSFYFKEHGSKNLGLFSPVQIKSATGNIGTYGTAEPDIRKSLRPNVPNDIERSINEKIAVRDEKTWLQRLMSAIVPTESDAFRQAVFNRYQRIGTREKLAAKKDNIEQYTADMSAEFAALQSDRAAELMASAMGIHDGKGGIPVYRNGFTMIWNDNGKITGPLDIFQPLAKLNDPKVFRDWQFWKSAQRGVRLDEVSGKPTQFGKDELAQAKRLEALYPEGLFKQVDQAWDRYNRGLVDYMVQTGVISRAMGNEWVKHADYFPFYRQQMDEDAKGPKMFSAISGVKAPKELKGGEDTVGDFFENIIRNTQSAIEAGMKNIAAQRAIDNELKIDDKSVKEVVGFKGEPKRPNSMTNVVTVLRNGETHYYECVDKLFIEAMKGLNMAEIPGLWFFSAPANLLRSFVTKTPDFIVANLLRDSMSAWVTSGANITPVIDTVKGFGAALANTDPDLKVLYDAGLIGGHEFSGKAKDTGKSLAKELRKRAGVKTTKEKILTPVTAVWEALEKGSTASDAATRLAVYKDTMAQTGNQAEAIRRAMEIMNFQRKGNSALIRIIAAAVPFLNARLQGIDVLYRAGIKPFVDRKNASEYEKAVANAFIKRGMLMMALSVMYYMMVRDDEDYLAQEEETRDGNWIIPGLGVKIPIPFEVGIIFKTIPERTTALLMGNDTGSQFMDSMARNLQQTFGLQLPQTILPAIEVATGYSFFTHRQITPAGMEDVAKEYQVAPSTSRLAEVLGQFTSMTTATGKSIGLSPIELDHLLKGYTGTLGTYFADVADVVIDANSDIKSPSKRFEQMPFIRRFALDPEARGNVTAYYELKNAVDQVVRTSNLLERTGKVEDFAEYQMNNMPLLASKDYVNELYKSMKEFNQMKQQIRSSTMDPDDKRDILLAIGQAEAGLVSQIKEYRKMIAE